MVEKVSQRILTEFKQITGSDGTKGITTNEERAKVAELLAGTSGNYNVNYLQGEIQKYDLEQAKNQANQDIDKDNEKAMKLDGNKNAINSDKEIAVLDAIIDNTRGNYSTKDIKYAKQVKKSFGLSESTPLAESQKQIQELQAQLEELKKALTAKEQEVAVAEAKMKNNQAKLENALNEGKISEKIFNNAKQELAKKGNEVSEFHKKLKNMQNNLNEFSKNGISPEGIAAKASSKNTENASSKNTAEESIKEFTKQAKDLLEKEI